MALTSADVLIRRGRRIHPDNLHILVKKFVPKCLGSLGLVLGWY